MKNAQKSLNPAARHLSIQWLRGIAVLLVVVSHFLNFGIAKGIKWTRFEFGAVGVDIFFVISGFIMTTITFNYASDKKLIRSFLLKRMIRIIPLYWIVLAVYLISLDLYLTVPVSNYQILTSFLFIPSYITTDMIAPIIIQGWSLNYEMYFYLVLALFILVAGRYAVLSMAFAFVLTTLFGINLPTENVLVKFYTNPLALEFILGCIIGLLYGNGARLKASKALLIILVGVTAMILLSIYYYVPVWGPYTRRVIAWGFPAFMIVAGAVFLEAASGPRVWQKSLPLLLGDASYAIYLVHFIGFTLGWYLLVDLDINFPLTLIFISTVLLGVGVHLFIERPLLKLLNSFFKFPVPLVHGNNVVSG